MTIPSTTPGTLGRSPRRCAMGGPLLAALLVAAVALTGATAAPDSQAAPPPDPPRTYKVTADVDGRLFPKKDEVYAVDFLLKGQRVPIDDPQAASGARRRRARAQQAGGWMAIGGAAAAVTGSTPIGIAIVAGLAGALVWRAAAGQSQARGRRRT